ncbi:MAG: hypothetical protein HDS64_00965 [Bacteroidales bacterium]|nr:hypothetical protein [Bacteroidales bacterium]
MILSNKSLTTPDVIGLGDNWESLLPELPESPYMYDDNDKKIQRVRHSSKK